MFTNPLFENNASREITNESFDTYNENYTFKPPQNEVLLEQARNSINNLMLKFDKPKKGEGNPRREEEEDDFKLLSESFLINLDKLNASHISMKPMDIDLNAASPHKHISSISQAQIKVEQTQTVSPILQQRPVHQTMFGGQNQKPLEEVQSKPQGTLNQQSQEEIRKIQNLENQNRFLEQTLEKFHQDQNHLLGENENLQRRIRELELEKSKISQKNMEDIANIQSLTQQLRVYQEQTSQTSQEFLIKKQGLTEQYERQIQELRETIQLNEDLLRKSINKDTLYEAVKVQMEDLQRSNNELQGRLSEVLTMLETSRDKFNEKERSLMGMIETLQKETENYRGREMEYEEEIKKLREGKDYFEENHEKYERRIREFTVLLERKEAELMRYRGVEAEFETMKAGLEKNTHELQNKYYENEESLLRYKTENMALEGVNRELKQNIEMMNEALKSLKRKMEENDGVTVEKEMGYRDKYMRLEELYKNSKEIIENYSRQLEDYKMEKELLIKQLLEEKSRNQQERMSFTDQKRYYEENMKKVEGGIQEKEGKIKNLMNDLLQKESFIRNSIYDKNQEFERIKQEYLKLVEHKEKEIQEIRAKNEILLKEKEAAGAKTKEIDQRILDKEGIIRSYERKVKEYEQNMKTIQEDNERILRETKEMQQHKTLLLENKVQQLQENLDRMSKQAQGETQLRKEYEEKLRNYEMNVNIQGSSSSSVNVNKTNVSNVQGTSLGRSFNPFFRESPENKGVVQSEIRVSPTTEIQKDYANFGQSDIRSNNERNLQKLNYNREIYGFYNSDPQKNMIQRETAQNNANKEVFTNSQREATQTKNNENIYLKEKEYNKDLYRESSKIDYKDSYGENFKYVNSPPINTQETLTNPKQTYVTDQKTLKNQETKSEIQKKPDIFLKKDTIREEEIFQEVTKLKNEVFEALQNYQKVLAAIQVKKVSSSNLKKYIGDNLQHIFLDYSKILFVFFKPNENFINLLNLNLYIDKPEEIRKKIFSKNQYLSFKDIYLQTGGSKEKEINEMMANCNDFILEFYEFIKRRHEKETHHKEKVTQPKQNAEQSKPTELYCGRCNGVFPIEIYRTHITTCDNYKGGQIYQEDVLNKNLVVEAKNTNNSIAKICENLGNHINEFQDSENRQKIMNLISNVKSLKIEDYRDYLIRDVKEMLGIKNMSNGLFCVLSRLLTVLENKKGDFGMESGNNKVDNIRSD